MRKLASIQKIYKIEPIENADRLEIAHVLGWQCVVPKGQFSEMENAVYFEVDSFLPVRDEFEFLRKTSYKKSDILGEGFRLKTLKLRGVLSQGLLMPMRELGLADDLAVGTNVTDVLGVRKWVIEERASTGGTIIGELPFGVPKTNEVRIQSEPGLIECFKGKPYYITTKMDGSSHSVSYDSDGYHVCWHNYEYSDGAFYDFCSKVDMAKRLEWFAESRGLESLVIQGEFCAPGIQKNPLKLKRPNWYVFTVIINGKRSELSEMLDVCHVLGLEHVPIEECKDSFSYSSVEELLERAKGLYPGGHKKEGLVIRPIVPEYCELIGAPLSMKVINNEYLLDKKK